MNVIGADALIFGVDDVGGCTQYLTDYGLRPVGVNAAGGRFEALDGTSVVIKHKDDITLPPPLGTASMLRKTLYGVQDKATLASIGTQVAKDLAAGQLPG